MMNTKNFTDTPNDVAADYQTNEITDSAQNPTTPTEPEDSASEDSVSTDGGSANALPDLPFAREGLTHNVIAVCGFSDAERARYIIEDRLIHYPALIAIVSQAKWMMLEPRQIRARGVVIPAERGNGKSSIAEVISKRFAYNRGEDRPCAVRITMSGARDARTVYGRILEALGSPSRISHRLSDREALVQRLLMKVDCRLLIMDETQDLLLGTEREQQKALEAIKLVMNELRMPVMAFGTEHAAEGFLSDGHLAARFKDVLSLPLWKADDVLANFLYTYESHLPLRKASHLDNLNIINYLVKCSDGILGNIVARLQNAALWAIADGSERITLSLLAKATTRPDNCLIDAAMDKAA